MNIKQLLQDTPIIPVITINDINHAVPLAKALIDGGINTLEITLRTPAAIDAIKLLKKEIPQCNLGAGTITTAAQFSAIQAAGVTFAVSPGITADLIQAAEDINMPYLPAVVTPSDILLAKQFNLTQLKFFPADISGGTKALKNFAVLFPEIQFCPTGGISLETMNDYLSLPNVFTIGGSWLAPQDLMIKGAWKEITQLTKEAMRRATCQ